MKRFARLYSDIDATTSTNRKVEAMVEYFARANAADAAWAVYFLSGGRPKRLIPIRRVAAWAMEESDIPEWLFEESYHSVGDLAETIALLLPVAPAVASDPAERPLHAWVEERLLPLGEMSEEEQKLAVIGAWRELAGTERFIWNKLITGAFRVGVSEQLVVRALARASGVEEGVVAHRLSGHWSPTAESFTQLVGADSGDADRSRPYPFYLAYALEGELESHGEAGEWQAEWKWDGIRAQLIRRNGTTYIWTRGGDLATDRFPELVAGAEWLPDGTVLDGEIMPWKDDAALSFAQLQRRIGRKKLGPKILGEVPVVLITYDLLELEGRDIRGLPLAERRRELACVVGPDRERESVHSLVASPLHLSPTIPLGSWDDARAAHGRSRDHRAEGLMLKRLDSEYGVGRRKGSWWKWKVQPFSIDAVMVYAQPGSGRRAMLHSDYTFAVRDGDALVPFAKAYSGLTDAEIRVLDHWIRRNTIEKYGPVRHVEPVQVFELAFEGIQQSPRHKSGVAVRFPRIARWRTDKPASEADTIETLRALLEAVK
ncbi:MAG: ATP-dependent DNA ligase [Gemmatimonadota bacterium]|nr:ATP-dependent DNA ligase [Gemmatimonadota bacterium]